MLITERMSFAEEGECLRGLRARREGLKPASRREFRGVWMMKQGRSQP